MDLGLISLLSVLVGLLFNAKHCRGSELKHKSQLHCLGCKLLSLREHQPEEKQRAAGVPIGWELSP